MLAAAAGVSDVDTDLLAAYSVAVCELRSADAVLQSAERYYTGPNGAICSHPAIRDRRSAMQVIASLSSSLGIGATARKRNNAKAPTAEPVDRLARYRKG